MDPDVRLLLFSQSRQPQTTGRNGRLLPTVVFQEFSNEERCNTAKSKFESSLKEAGATRYLAKSADSGSVLPFSNPRFFPQAIGSVALGGGSIWSTCITTPSAICSL